MFFLSCGACQAWHGRLPVPDQAESSITCTACGDVRPFRRLPLLAITGTIGIGKTSLAQELSGLLPHCVVVDQDILWRGEYEHDDAAATEFQRTWLRMAIHIHQAGRPVVISGAVTPGQYEAIEPLCRYFSSFHYLALVADKEEIDRRASATARLATQPPEAMAGVYAFNQWFRENTERFPTMTLLDVTDLALGETAVRARAWVDGLVPP